MSSSLSTNAYTFINATDVKSFIINQLSNSDNALFSGASYLGSNMNAIVDVVAVMVQQVLFHLSLNTSQASFATANLYESMNKLVSILDYKCIGKQTSMLPVRFEIDVTAFKADHPDAKQITIPRLSKLSYNSNYYLKNEIIIPINEQTSDRLYYNTILFQGNVQQITDFEAVGDEFETFLIRDTRIKTSNQFISDNFFIVYVDQNGTGEWVEYTEAKTLFAHDGDSTVFERRFNEDMNYELKFGNGIHGRKLNSGANVVVFYLISNGQSSVVGDGIVMQGNLTPYSSGIYSSILQSNYTTTDMNSNGVGYVKVINTGASSAISYPESVSSIRANAPKIFASQNRLFTLGDFKIHVEKNFNQYLKDTYFCNNDEYTRDFLKYYYDLGLTSPQQDSRINIAQVQFMTSTNFNNVYAFLLPKVNTIIGDTVPNYINTTIKHEIVNSVADYKGLTHNLVLLDPIYKAITFGFYMDDQVWNSAQLENNLVLVRNRLTKYSYSFIKDYAVSIFNNYFKNLKLGSSVDLAQLSKQILAIPGVKRFYMRNNQDDVENKLTFYCWNPLYINEDNFTTQQTILNEPFVYPYFYNLKNISNLIVVEDE